MENYATKIMNCRMWAEIFLGGEFSISVIMYIVHRYAGWEISGAMQSNALGISVVLFIGAFLFAEIASLYTKHKFKKLREANSLEAKLMGYHSCMQILKNTIAVFMTLTVGVNVIGQVPLYFTFLIFLALDTVLIKRMSSNPYLLMQRLQLSAEEVTEVYGEGWQQTTEEKYTIY